MTNTGEHPTTGPLASRHWAGADRLLPLLLAFLLGAAMAIVCWLAAGVSLGFFFGPLLLASFIAPPLAMSETRPFRRLLGCLALSAGAWGVWLVAGNLSALDAGRCGLVLIAWVVALAGAGSLLERLRLGEVFASGVTVFAAMLWIAWPVWLSPSLGGPHAQTVVAWLATAHPLMAMNAVLFARFDFWDRYTLAYQQLTILNQDVLYSLPRTIGWMALAHLAVGLAGLISMRPPPTSADRREKAGPPRRRSPQV